MIRRCHFCDRVGVRGFWRATRFSGWLCEDEPGCIFRFAKRRKRRR